MAEKYWDYLKLKNGDQVHFIPPAPNGDKLGGISEEELESFRTLSDDMSALQNTDKAASAGKVWTATADGAGWADHQGGTIDQEDLFSNLSIGPSFTGKINFISLNKNTMYRVGDMLYIGVAFKTVYALTARMDYALRVDAAYAPSGNAVMMAYNGTKNSPGFAYIRGKSGGLPGQLVVSMSQDIAAGDEIIISGFWALT